jgi:sugar phosphate isomerase/epimerase
MTAHHGHWPRLVSEATAISTVAVELSARSENELPSLMRFVEQAPVLPFLFVSVHGPTKGREMAEDELVDAMRLLAGRVDAIVMHPDVMREPGRFRELGSTLALENMDRRKEVGQTAAHLAEYFAELPDAGLCLDVPHAASVDPTLAVAHDLLDAHRHRLRHVHLSSLDERCHHRSLTAADQERFAPVLDRCRDVPWILEAPPA